MVQISKNPPFCSIFSNKMAIFRTLNQSIFAANGRISIQTSVSGFLQHALPNKYMILAIANF